MISDKSSKASEQPLRYLFLLLIGMFIAAPQVLGDQACRVLQENFNNRECYISLQCGMNVRNLLFRFQAAGEDLAAYDVVFLMHRLHRISGGPLMPTSIPLTGARQGTAVKSFAAHFFILHNGSGRVYDLDYRPSAPSVADYARGMFGTSEPAMLVVKRLGARQYLELLESRGVQSNDGVGQIVTELRGPTPAWPEARLSDVIQSYAPQ